MGAGYRMGGQREGRAKGGSACREAPRTLSPTVQSGAILFLGEDGRYTARSVEDGRRVAVEGGGKGSGTAVGWKKRAREAAIF